MHRFSRLLERTLAWALILLMGFSVVNVLWQVFTRFVLDNPSSYTEELARYLLIWVGVLAAAYGVATKGHLAIDLLPLKLHGRKRQWLEVFIQLSVAGFAAAVMIVGGIRLVGITLYLQQTSAALGVKLGYVYTILPVSGFVMLYFSIVHLIDALRAPVEGRATGDDAAVHTID
jgi:TRAP-type C4-dicarboxylate transport system permease small subunit